MKTITLAFAMLLSSTSLLAQQLPEWYRVRTFDDSIVEMNTAQMILSGDRTGRVKFRWSFEQPQVLRGATRATYKTEVEVIEFDCAKARYRRYEDVLFDAAGKVVWSAALSPARGWQPASGTMDNLFTSACRLIESKKRAPVVVSEPPDLKRAESFALSFSERLEQTRDFAPLLKELFAPDYLKGYIQDKETNWFLNLNRDVAAQVSPAELQRFYVAALNAGYLTGLYLISQAPDESDEDVSEEQLTPPELFRLIKEHPYSTKYKGALGNYDYLAENIDSVERLRSYTDLLEKVSVLMRQRVGTVKAERSDEYRAAMNRWHREFGLYAPTTRVCAAEYLGLPKGAKLYEVNLSMFRLELAEINGELRIVSIRDYLR